MFSGLFWLSRRFFCVCKHFYAWILFSCIKNLCGFDTMCSLLGTPQVRARPLEAPKCPKIVKMNISGFLHYWHRKKLSWNSFFTIVAYLFFILAPRVSPYLHIYNWILFRHKSGYKRRKISCSVKIILKTSFLSDFDPFMGSQLFLCMHKSQIWFINVQ